MALKTAKQSGLNIQKDTLKLATKSLDFVSSESGAFYGYTSPPNPNPSYREQTPTAIGLLCRMYLGWDRDHPSIKRGVSWLAEVGPVLRSSRNEQGVNMYHNYYATQVMKQFGGPEWEKWNNEMRDFLVKSIDKEGAERGSWFFDSGNDQGTEPGGRLYYTSLCCMTLEVYYRYMPLYEGQDSAAPFLRGILRGGSLRNRAASCQSATRSGSTPSNGSDYAGFRIAMSLPQARTATLAEKPSEERNMIYVKLNLPNTTEAGAAASVLGVLAKIESASNIKVDPSKNTCEFWVNKDIVTLKAKLDEFAKTNDHFAEWSFAEGSDIR